MSLVTFSGQATELKISGKPSQLSDNAGLIYIGVKIPAEQLTPYLDRLSRVLGEETFKAFRQNQAARDHDSFHITLINPYEFKEIDASKVDMTATYHFQLLGLGTAANNEDRTYFVVAESGSAQSLRGQLKLGPKDFHVTLGFKDNDVFGVSKSRQALLSR